MAFNYSINSSQNALVINLSDVRLQDIVGEKLKQFLKQNPTVEDIFDRFYKPPEQAIIELILIKRKGNQLKVAEILGINRNTLKKKILEYRLNIRELLTGPKNVSNPQSLVFLSSANSLDLLSVSRAKLAKMEIPEDNILETLGQPIETIIVKHTLEYCKGNQFKTSQLLGINRNTLKKKMKLIPKKELV